MELRGQGDVGRLVDLVGGDHHRLRSTTQELRQLVVARPQTRLGVDDEHHGVRLRQRGTDLFADLGPELGAVFQVNAAGIDQRQRPAVPLGGQLLAVAGHAGALVHDRLPRLGEAVDER